MNDNIMVPLSEVAKIDISGVDKKTKENEIPVLLCNFTDVYYNWSITKNMVPGFMKATANKKEIDRFSLTKGQVVITKDSETRDDIGMSAYIADDLPETILGYHCAVITPDEKALDGRYLNAYLSSRYGRKYFEYKAGGSGQRYTLTVEGISNIKIPLIPLSEQKKIGKFLSNLDKKIENNNAISSQLESLAKTIYDYWFFQFDFPDENGNPYRSSGGKMVWNDELKREIPEGWEVKRIMDIEDNIITGKTPSTENMRNYGKDIPFICIGDIRNHPFVASTNIKLSKSGADSQKKKYIPAESLCVTCIASPGLVGFTTEISQTNQQINSISFSKEYNKPFMYFAIKSYFENSSGAKTGNTFANMNKKDFSSIQLLYNEETVRKYYCFVNNVFSEIKNIELENQQLTSLRDFLLPMLMNGQVTFKEG